MHGTTHGVVGLMRAYANALASHSIRVNSVHPTGVDTPMIVNEPVGLWVAEHPEAADVFGNAMPVPLVEPLDVSNAIVWLCSDEARYVTGITLRLAPVGSCERTYGEVDTIPAGMLVSGADLLIVSGRHLLYRRLG
jgi:NAD(P)-dependent dehydrogenase (short-subunit alcohol dehydrogenase family)